LSLPVLDLIATLFYNVFGSPVILTAVIIFMIILMLAVLRADISVMLMVLIPLMAGLLLNVAGSNFVSLPPWILIVIFLIAGFVFSALFLFFIK